MLVSKKITIHAGDPPVEVLAGEQTEQSYELHLTHSGPAPVYVGDSDVSATSSVSLPSGPLRLRGVSLWVVGPSAGTASTTLSVLAYSSDG